MDGPHLIPRINAYLASLSLEKGYADSTCRAYRHDLHELAAFVAGNRAPESDGPARLDEVDASMLRCYLGHLHQKNKKTTIARKLAAIRSFFRYLVRQEVVTDNPTDRVLTPRREKTIPAYLSVDDMFRLLDSVEAATLLQARNRAMFETLYSSGIRVSELVGLDLADVDADRGMLRVTGKGEKERLVPVGKKALGAIGCYRQQLEDETGISADPDSPLFLNKDRGRLTARSVGRILEKIVLAAGIPVPISPHGFRHSFASHMLDGGADLRVLQELLGHKHLSTTQKYTHVSIDKLMETYDKAHPRR